MRAIVLIAMMAIGCGTSSGPECIDNGDCSDGQACLLEVCEDVECLASEDCNIREYCNTETYVCRAGCEDDGDCIAGESCDTASNTCEEYGCRDTQLDCAIGEICREVTGECEFAHAGHCDRCEPDPFAWEMNGTCANRNAVCGTYDGVESFCFQPCVQGQADACPRGYECVEQASFGGTFCSAFCPTLYENGWK